MMTAMNPAGGYQCLEFITLAEYGSFSFLTQDCKMTPTKRFRFLFPKQCGNTWGSYGNSKKPGWLDRGGGRGSVQNSSLFSWFRACMFVSSVNFRSFGLAATDAHGFCL